MVGRWLTVGWSLVDLLVDCPHHCLDKLPSCIQLAAFRRWLICWLDFRTFPDVTGKCNSAAALDWPRISWPGSRICPLSNCLRSQFADIKTHIQTLNVRGSDHAADFIIFRWTLIQSPGIRATPQKSPAKCASLVSDNQPTEAGHTPQGFASFGLCQRFGNHSS